MKNNRMIFDVSPEVQMAIKLAAVKRGCTTGEVVTEAIRKTFPLDLNQAQEELERSKEKAEPTNG
jgi:hypothetical protein